MRGSPRVSKMNLANVSITFCNEIIALLLCSEVDELYDIVSNLEDRAA